MLRNRGGNFIYDVDDVNQMKSSLKELKQLDIQGIVFGALHVDNTVNVKLTQEICQLAGALPVTFHKAIDSCHDILAATKQLIQTDIEEILTSGGKKTAHEGIVVLRQMLEIAQDAITIMSAGKVTKQNLEDLQESIGGTHFHGKLIVGVL